MTRRTKASAWFKLAAAAFIAAASQVILPSTAGAQPAVEHPAPPVPANPTTSDLINQVQHRAFDFFWNETDPTTGITKDRAGNFASDTYTVGSIASTGYALAALPRPSPNIRVQRERRK